VTVLVDVLVWLGFLVLMLMSDLCGEGVELVIIETRGEAGATGLIFQVRRWGTSKQLFRPWK
jgi:hypothetical protein